MKKYSIKDIEHITGIKAHTIRIWEQRYNLIEPKRTETNIRYYDKEDIRRFLNVSILLDNGMRISEISKLSQEDIKKKLSKISGCKDGACACSESIICEAMFKFDSLTLSVALNTCIESGGLEYTMMNVLTPFLIKIKSMQLAGTASEAHIQQVYRMVRNPLIVQTEALDVITNPEKDRYLLFLPEGEWGEIGLLFAAYLLKKREYPYLYLGENIPYSDIPGIVNIYKPDKALCVWNPEADKGDISCIISKLCKIDFKHLLLFPGKSFHTAEGQNFPTNLTTVPFENILQKLK